MKSILLFLILSTLSPLLGQEKVEAALRAAPKAMGSITSKDLQRHLSVLASDEYRGRLTGTPSQQRTAEYIAKQFASYGLEPQGDEEDQGRSWMQAYDIQRGYLNDGSGLFTPKGQAIVEGGVWIGAPKEELSLEAPLRFLGSSARGSKDDKLDEVIPVVVLRMRKTKRVTMGSMFGALSKLRQVGRRLSHRGAKVAVVLVPEYTPALLNALNMLAVYPDRPMIRKSGTMDAAAMMGRSRVPILVVSAKNAHKLTRAMGVSWDRVQGGESASPKLLKGDWRVRIAVRWEAGQATNVVGVLRGSDPKLAGEALVYSAHMDHVGMGADGKAYNGADDNGSGTSSLLEMAQAYSRLPKSKRPRRSVIFLSVSGEELGLWGSEHFSKHPTWPLNDIIADINIDMIGRSTKKVPLDTISVTPTFRHKAYSSLVREAAFLGGSKAFGLHLANGDRFYMRSDHYNFARKGVPVVFFCDDEHEDYHQQSDDVEKIEFKKVERIARMAFLLGYRTLNRDGRPEVLGKKSDWFDE